MKNLKWSQKHKWTHSNKYVMPLPEEIFNALGQAKVFNTLDLKFNYHQLPFKGGWQGQDENLGNQYKQEGLFVPMEMFAIFGLKYIPEVQAWLGYHIWTLRTHSKDSRIHLFLHFSHDISYIWLGPNSLRCTKILSHSCLFFVFFT
jgi:hypothetical protein